MNLDAELPSTVTAFPALLRFQVIGFFGFDRSIKGTIRASGLAVWPFHCGHEVNAYLFIAKVLNRFE
jgi:hypothetical protein